jgi:hypothetical protein
MQRFSEYSAIDKDEIRKQGLRVLSYAYKYGKACELCGWGNINHLWLSSLPLTCSLAKGEAGDIKKWVPLDRVPQKKLIYEMEQRCLVCAVCRRLAPVQRPQYDWTKCIKQVPCVECGLAGLEGWARFEHDGSQTKKASRKRGPPLELKIESQRCGRCKRKFDRRVHLAKELNWKCKAKIGQCELCLIKVKDLGSAAFDWDHLDQKLKSGNIGSMTMVGESIHDIRLEIDKCRLLCVRCHLDHTFKQLGYSDPVPKIAQALEKAKVRTFNEIPLDLCDSSDELE